jgi:hypothetical protein
MDVDSADLVAADQQPVAATGQYLALQSWTVDHATVVMNVSRVPSAGGDQLCRLKFDVHVEEVFSGQRSNSGS